MTEVKIVGQQLAKLGMPKRYSTETASVMLLRQFLNQSTRSYDGEAIQGMR